MTFNSINLYIDLKNNELVLLVFVFRFFFYFFNFFSFLNTSIVDLQCFRYTAK